MIARYRDSRVEAAQAGEGDEINEVDGANEVNAREGVVRVSLELENRGRETWASNEGFSVSYQVLDAESDNLITEGPRLSFPGEVAPGQTARVELSVRIPAEPGRYLVFVSPIKEDEAWFFERGSDFLLIEAEVGAAGVDIIRHTVISPFRLRLQRLGRTLGRAFVYPPRTIFRNRSLIRSMVGRDISARYRGSYGGRFWTIIHPLLMMLTYYFVFGVVLRTRFGDDGRSSNFVLYFLAGMLPWLAFSEAVGRAPGVVIEHASFVKKLIFPVETLPVNLAVAGLFSEAFGVAIFLAGMLVFGHPLPVTALWLPVILLPQFLFTLGICWFLAALGVFFRDVGQVIGFLLTVWFFTTPICYPEASLPQDYLWVFQLNPMYVLVRGYRAVFLEASAPEWKPLAALGLVGAFAFVAGHAWFYRLKKSFADVI